MVPASDYRSIFPENLAEGLGLGPPRPASYASVEEYEQDPAAAFSRMAERSPIVGGTPFEPLTPPRPEK